MSGWVAVLFGVALVFLFFQSAGYRKELYTLCAEPALLRWSPFEHEKRASLQQRVDEIKQIQAWLWAAWIFMSSLLFAKKFRWVWSDTLELVVWGLCLLAMQLPYILELSKMRRYACDAPLSVQNHVMDSFLVHDEEVYFFDGEGDASLGMHYDLKLERIEYDRGRLDERPHMIFVWMKCKTHEPFSLRLPIPEGMEDEVKSAMKILQKKYSL